MAATYTVSGNRDEVVAGLRQMLDYLESTRKDLDARLGEAAIIAQAKAAINDADRLYSEAQSAIVLGDHRDALRRKGQAELAHMTASRCVAQLLGEGDYDG